MTDPRDLLRRCAEDRREAVLALARARADLRALRPALDDAVYAAAAAGVPKAEIARLAQVTRQTVYETLRRGLPADLASVLRDQSVVVPQDAAVFELIAAWAKAPAATASAEATVEPD